MLKVTIDLQGCLLENTFFKRCFKEDHGKLYIMIVKLINIVESEIAIYFAIFVLIGTGKPTNAKKMTVHTKLYCQPVLLPTSKLPGHYQSGENGLTNRVTLLQKLKYFSCDVPLTNSSQKIFYCQTFKRDFL